MSTKKKTTNARNTRVQYKIKIVRTSKYFTQFFYYYYYYSHRAKVLTHIYIYMCMCTHTLNILFNDVDDDHDCCSFCCCCCCFAITITYCRGKKKMNGSHDMTLQYLLCLHTYIEI